mmetsp:Transcript_2909/g.5912  ORF Transcript_2909/g.5912 Transcript_2909/m.5912 type:complete len:234 (+) Transcript_2909:1138-1839(+)
MLYHVIEFSHSTLPITCFSMRFDDGRIRMGRWPHALHLQIIPESVCLFIARPVGRCCHGSSVCVHCTALIHALFPCRVECVYCFIKISLAIKRFNQDCVNLGIHFPRYCRLGMVPYPHRIIILLIHDSCLHCCSICKYRARKTSSSTVFTLPHPLINAQGSAMLPSPTADTHHRCAETLIKLVIILNKPIEQCKRSLSRGTMPCQATQYLVQRNVVSRVQQPCTGIFCQSWFL